MAEIVAYLTQIMNRLLFGICLLLVGCAKSRQMQSNISFASNVVVAHRGAFKAQSFPENSIASLKEAIRLGCTGAEFDVHMTADDSLVVNHDKDYHRLDIEKTAYAQLAAFPLKNGEPLPTLRKYLLAGMEGNKQTRLVLEIKPSGMGRERARAIAQKVVQLVKELHAEPYVVYISFDYNMLLDVLSFNPAAQTQYLEGNKSPEEVKRDGIAGIDYHYSVFQKHPEWIVAAKQLNIKLNAWTVNDPKLMDWLLANKFDFITTNEPEMLLQKLHSAKK